jgi:hypothetical protein
MLILMKMGAGTSQTEQRFREQFKAEDAAACMAFVDAYVKDPRPLRETPTADLKRYLHPMQNCLRKMLKHAYARGEYSEASKVKQHLEWRISQIQREIDRRSFHLNSKRKKRRRYTHKKRAFK